MVKYTPEFKHNILTLYQPHSRGNGLKALATRFKIKSGEPLLLRWYRQWNGTVESLKRSKQSGRPRALSTTESKIYIRNKIAKHNQQFHGISYPQLYDSLPSKIKQKISIRSFQRYGLKKEGIKKKKTIKRTKIQCKKQNVKENSINSFSSMFFVFFFCLCFFF